MTLSDGVVAHETRTVVRGQSPALTAQKRRCAATKTIVETYLDEVLALSLCDKRLKLRGGEGVDKASLGDDQEQNLRSGKDRQFVGLQESMVSLETRQNSQINTAIMDSIKARCQNCLRHLGSYEIHAGCDAKHEPSS